RRAVVSIESAVAPALVISPLSAMVKQPACAAAISSSGLVPTPSAKRALKLYCVSFNVPLWVEIVPLPSLRLPCQTADALRSIVYLLFFLVALITSSYGTFFDALCGIKELENRFPALVFPDAKSV